MMGNKRQWILCAFIMLYPALIQSDTQGDIRVADGGRPDRGRVEIFQDSQWVTLCGDFHRFVRLNVDVICRQLGFNTTNDRAYTTDLTGDDPISEYFPVCDGSEDRLDDCPRFPYNCSTESGVAAVECGTIEGDIRLANGSTEYEGRVEIFHDGQWGTICGDDWDDDDATVLCAQLGYVPYGAVATSGGAYGNGSGPIHLGDVECIGTETKLNKCNINGWGNNSCDHSQDAGVICNPPKERDVRLVNGPSLNEGRVEIYLSGQWGTVCDDSWDDKDAWVVCRQLGFKPFSGASFSGYGRGTGPIHLDDVQCSGEEVRLEACTRNSGNHNCGHHEDAGVKCFLPDDGDVRIHGGDFGNRGRVDIYYDGQWGSVCASEWDGDDASVVCQQFRYKPYAGRAISGTLFDQGSVGTVHLDHVGCGGRESRLDACHSNITAIDSCGDAGYAAVDCRDPEEGDVHLFGGSTSNEGRVEIYHAGQWGTICDNSWTDQDAWAVCRQLGYQPNNGTARIGDTYGQGIGPIHLDDVGCSGDEWRLDTCSLSRWGSVASDCDHSRDAGAVCNIIVPQDWDVRLVDGPTSNQGRLEIYANHQWGTVCDKKFTTAEAAVVCRQLGFQVNIISGEVEAYGPGTGPIHLLDEELCSGRESSLDECVNISSGLGNCTHLNDVGVRCINTLEGDVRLVGGPSSDEGRVEIFHDDRWGTICDDNWDDQDARVVCRQLGYLGDIGIGVLVGARDGLYDAGVGLPIFLENVYCTGDEDRLDSCMHGEWGVHDCTHYEDAGVRCIVPTTPQPPVTIPPITSIRLVGSSSEYEGRLEVYSNGQWGTVCGINWGFQAAVVCRQLGYPTHDPEAVEVAEYGQGSGPILFWISCSGPEQDLNECYRDNDAEAYCTSNNDVAAVRCNDKPATPGRVVGIMAFVGVSLSLLTLVAFVAVWHTCNHSKVVKTPSEVPSIPLNTVRSRSATDTAPVSNEDR